MKSPILWIVTAATALLLSLSPRAALAEMPTYAYVGHACSQETRGPRFFRNAGFFFTYHTHEVKTADGGTNTLPDFPSLPASEDHGLSSQKMTLSEPNSMSGECAYNIIVHGVDLPVDDDKEWINLWVSGREVLHHYPVEPSLEALLVIDGEVRRCDAVKGEHVCKTLGIAEKMGDRKEGPFSTLNMMPGRIAVVEARDKPFCQALIRPQWQDGDPTVPFLIKPDNHDDAYQVLPLDQEVISFREGAIGETLLDTYHSEYAEWIMLSAFDLTNAGNTEVVVDYVGETHAFSGNYFVAIPLSQATDAAIKSVNGLTDEQLRGRGWFKFGGGDTVFKTVYTTLDAGRIDGATYLLAHGFSELNPVAQLLKPSADGKLSSVCLFERVGSEY